MIRDCNRLKKILRDSYPFIFAFVMMLFYLMPRVSMADSSGDAADIWHTIKTYGQDDMYGSYVLYKGFNAVYPYLWFYRMSIFLGLDEWFFVKLFYCFSFSYVSAIGFPNMIEMLTKEKVKAYRKLILVVLCFYFWEYTYALNQFMVDLPCLMYFVLMINSALRIYRKDGAVGNYIWLGALIGLNMCASGQYTAPAMCIMIFSVLVALKKNKPLIMKFRDIGVMLLMAIFLRCVNSVYIDKIVGPLIERGAWIPDGSVWLSIGLSRFMYIYRWGPGTVALPANRNMAIFQAFLGEESYSQMYDTILAGGYGMTVIEYIQLVLKYPFDFILCYLEKFLLVLSPDKGGLNFVPLCLFYTLLFIALYLGYRKCKTVGSIFNVKFWIGFAFLWSIVPALVMVVEPRYGLQIQGLVIALVVCNDFIWESMLKVKNNIITFLKEKRKINFTECRVPYVFFIYVFFLVLCLMNIASLYEQIGVNSNLILMGF